MLSKNTYIWDTTAMSEGTHTLQMFAGDKALNEGASQIIHVRIHHVLWGDLNGDGAVTVDEVLRAVNIALSGPTPGEDLSWIDSTGDGQVTVDEILVAVNNALKGPDAAALPRSRTGAIDLDALMARAQQKPPTRPRHPSVRSRRTSVWPRHPTVSNR